MATAPKRSTKNLGRAQYAAIQFRSAVRIYAVGFNPTAGYDNFFEQLQTTIWPPEFAFYSVPPDVPVPTVITFFEVHTSFAASETVKVVNVHDADGLHRVPVWKSRRTRGGDPPFPNFAR